MHSMLVVYLETLQASDRLLQDHHSVLVSRWSELELQAFWYSGACGKAFRSVDGALIEILDFGFWNREPGPDFVHATIRVDGTTVLTGGIEIDLHAQNWERHRHGDNPDFNQVILHVFTQQGPGRFFTGTSDYRQVFQVLLPDNAGNRETRDRSPLVGACQSPLRNLTDEKIDSLLETAAQIRLQRKAQLLREMVRIHGVDEALFQQIAIALGYKANKTSFLIVAQRARLKSLPKDQQAIEAILFGLAGFLEDQTLLRNASPSTKSYVEELWSTWWRWRSQLNHLILDRRQWRFSSSRPQNHPHRRLGTLAVLAGSWSKVRLLTRNFAEVNCFFRQLSHPFWNEHFSLKAKAPSPIQLIGETRIKDIIANVFFPLFWIDEPGSWTEFGRMRAELGNKRLEQVCQRLFGDRERAGKHTKFLYQQQGLLQVFEDFCLANAESCSGCKFPELIQRLRD
jgi:Protein of unknown function (DUF2851)